MPNIDFTNPDVRQWLNLILIFLVCVLLYIAYKLTRYIDTKTADNGLTLDHETSSLITTSACFWLQVFTCTVLFKISSGPMTTAC